MDGAKRWLVLAVDDEARLLRVLQRTLERAGFSVLVAGVIVAQDWRRVHFRSAAGLVLASLFGIPLGVLLLAKANDHVVKSILGLIIVAFSLVGRLLPTDKLGMSLEIGTRFASTTMLVMLPLVFLIATLQTLAAAFAKSFREAQTYLSLLMFVPAVPTMLLSLFPVKTEMWMYAVPLMGQQITITRLMRGDFVAPEQLAVCFVATAAAAVVVYMATIAVYRGERLAIST